MKKLFVLLELEVDDEVTKEDVTLSGVKYFAGDFVIAANKNCTEKEPQIREARIIRIREQEAQPKIM